MSKALFKLQPDAVPLRDRPASRVGDWDEVPLGYTKDEAVREAGRCLQCPAKRCEDMCPIHMPIARLLYIERQGREREAATLIREFNPVPSVMGRVCPQDLQCESALGCVVGKAGDAVRIGPIEQRLGDWFALHGEEPPLPHLEPLSGKVVAVIGSGPAGLAAAAGLRKRGHAVEIFEALPKPGGVLSYGIPDFRLPKDIIRREVAAILKYGDIGLNLGQVVTRTFHVNKLYEKFDAIFVATGAGAPIPLGIPGENMVHVLTANELLTRINLFLAHKEGQTQLPLARRVVVFGGSNVAMDAVRSALRMAGVEEVLVYYRRSRDEMPARSIEIHHADEEGMHLTELVAPVRFIGENGVATAVECEVMKLGEPDQSGRRRPVSTGKTFVTEADLFVIAIGARPGKRIYDELNALSRDLGLPELPLARGGSMLSDERKRLLVPGIVIGGDLAGGGTAVRAAGDGMNGAVVLDEYIRDGYWPTPDEYKTK